MRKLKDYVKMWKYRIKTLVAMLGLYPIHIMLWMSSFLEYLAYRIGELRNRYARFMIELLYDRKAAKKKKKRKKKPKARKKRK